MKDCKEVPVRDFNAYLKTPGDSYHAGESQVSLGDVFIVVNYGNLSHLVVKKVKDADLREEATNIT